jgi:formylmethanofuran dehydrogenase subunit B
MPNSIARKSSGERAASELFDNVTCPFCGMLCDDLEVERSGSNLKVRKNGCGRSVAGFERKLPEASPLIRGKPVALQEAIAAAATLIGQAQLPLFGGLATDVEGMRAVMSLAERSGGVVDHALSEGQYRNVKVLQTTGWTTTTLTETRNRADLIIVAGSDMDRLHPRFFERIVAPDASMFDVPAPKRTLVFIGKAPDASFLSGLGDIVTIPCKIEEAGEVLGLLRARLHGFRVPPPPIKGVTLAAVDALAERCRNAKYGVVVWAPPSLDFAGGELVVDQIAGLVKDLNQTMRFAGLSLGGSEGATTAGSVSTWLSGYPLRLSFASGAPDYNPYHYAISRMLADGEGDVLVWLASFAPDLVPPPTKLPTIVLGTPGLKLKAPAAVFIPVGTPGVDESGRLIRCDSVVSLPLRDLHRADLPRAADIFAAIEAAL